MSFTALKNRRQAQMEALQSKLSDKRVENTEDKRYWKPTLDAAGNANIVMRWLPVPPQDLERDGDPYVTMYKYAFEGPRGWYIENSPKTIGQPDPVFEYNGRCIEEGRREDVIRRQTRYIANILILKEPNAPENEGKVFLFEFGKKILDKIKECLRAQDESEIMDEDDRRDPFDPFDLWKGANFTMKITQVNVKGRNMSNYDSSKFSAPKPLYPDDAKMEAVWLQSHSLLDEIGPDKFKQYDALSKRFNKVMDIGTTQKTLAEELADAEQEEAVPAKSNIKQAKAASSLPEIDATDDLSLDNDWFKEFKADSGLSDLDDDVPF